jgi:L-amino acid N-acyltransferase YncA
MKLIRCDTAYSEPILAIFNEAIINSTALYDYKPRSLASMTAWFENKTKGNYPVIGAVTDTGALLGFTSYGPFRAHPAYKYTVEHSVYIAVEHRGKGLGKQLLQAIIRAARDQDYHALIGAIDSENAASIRLHRSCGFKQVGKLPEIGYKFGRWLDVDFYQLILDTPTQPSDG